MLLLEDMVEIGCNNNLVLLGFRGDWPPCHEIIKVVMIVGGLVSFFRDPAIANMLVFKGREVIMGLPFL